MDAVLIGSKLILILIKIQKKRKYLLKKGVFAFVSKKNNSMENIFLLFDENLILIYLLIFTVILGFEVISKVPTVLHTPLMSGANAISGVVIIGAILLIRNANPSDYITLSLGALGAILGMINVVGGFAVTNRMLKMFQKKKK